jgi:peptidoglycan/xylan/chitin deacetylase (PgdA/CDA1 family)
MYHEIESRGRPLCETAPGYARYVVGEQDFKSQLARIKSLGFTGVSVTGALGAADHKAVAITFDDGCETDLTAAAPLLKEFGFGATFYVIAGRTGLRGYLSNDQLRRLSELGFEIGCHSMTHSYLTDLSARQLRVEIVESKQRLEQVIGAEVRHFSCPGGRWSRRAAELCEEAGYDSMATSRVGANSGASDRFRLSRVAVMRDTAVEEFDRVCRAEGFRMKRARNVILNTAKTLLGNSAYEKVRARLLDHGA